MKLQNCLILYAILIGLSISVTAQPTIGGTKASAFEMNTSTFGFISVTDKRDYSPVGETHLYEDWKLANIEFKNGMAVKDIRVKLDLYHNRIDFDQNDGKIRTYQIDKIREIAVRSGIDSMTYFYNPSSYRFHDKVPLIGLVSPIDTVDNWIIVKHYQVHLQESNYVEALDAGKHEDEYILETQVLVGKDQILYPADCSRSKFIKALDIASHQKHELKKYMKEKNLNNKDMKELPEILKYLNSI